MLVENELNKLKTFDSTYFIGKSHFEEDGTQNNLVFEPINEYFKVIENTKYISSWKSKGLSDETIKSSTTFDNSLSPLIDYLGDKIRLIFNGDCLKQPKVTYTHRKTVNIYIVCELGASSSFSDDPTLNTFVYLCLSPTSLFGAVRLTKNPDIDKYQYSGYGTGFDIKSSFSFPGGEFGQNVIVFGVDKSSSVHVDNKKRTF